LDKLGSFDLLDEDGEGDGTIMDIKIMRNTRILAVSVNREKF